MRIFCYGLTTILVVALAWPALAKDYDVCVDPATDFRLDDADGDGGFSAGDGFVAVGIIVPGGTIPDGGVASCSDIVSTPIGTFFARGRLVIGLPAAESDDLAYVDWQFRINGAGAIDTSGPVKVVSSGGTYYQTIVGATGGLALPIGQALTTQLDAAGFQIRLSVPK